MSYKFYNFDGLLIEKSDEYPVNFTGFFKYSSSRTDYWFKEWNFNGKKHRIDGPAVEYSNGTKYWYVHGNLHRLDGPAIEYFDGRKYWYVDDKKITELQCKCLHDIIKLKGWL